MARGPALRRTASRHHWADGPCVCGSRPGPGGGRRGPPAGGGPAQWGARAAQGRLSGAVVTKGVEPCSVCCWLTVCYFMKRPNLSPVFHGVVPFWWNCWCSVPDACWRVCSPTPGLCILGLPLLCTGSARPKLCAEDFRAVTLALALLSGMTRWTDWVLTAAVQC